MTVRCFHIGTNYDREEKSFDVIRIKKIVGHPIETMFRDQMENLVSQGLTLPVISWKGIDKCQAIYAEQDSKILGFIVLVHNKHSKSLWKSLSFVYPEHRNKGIFKTLHSYLDDIARDMGCIAITSHVHVKNTNQLEILEKIGLKKIYYFVGKYVK
jgi:GNAT superfamily N-acetyltransferase